jgi:hypothetical protein
MLTVALAKLSAQKENDLDERQIENSEFPYGRTDNLRPSPKISAQIYTRKTGDFHLTSPPINRI